MNPRVATECGQGYHIQPGVSLHPRAISGRILGSVRSGVHSPGLQDLVSGS